MQNDRVILFNLFKVNKYIACIYSEKRINRFYLNAFLRGSRVTIINLYDLNLEYRECRLLQRIFPMSSHSCLKLEECTLSDRAIIELKEVASKVKGFCIYKLYIRSTNQLRAFTNMLEFMYSLETGYNRIGVEIDLFQIQYMNYDKNLSQIIKQSVKQQIRIIEKNKHKFNEIHYPTTSYNNSNHIIYGNRYLQRLVSKNGLTTFGRFNFREKDISILSKCSIIDSFK